MEYRVIGRTRFFDGRFTTVSNKYPDFIGKSRFLRLFLMLFPCMQGSARGAPNPARKGRCLLKAAKPLQKIREFHFKFRCGIYFGNSLTKNIRFF